jgi:hypothetical protein
VIDAFARGGAGQATSYTKERETQTSMSVSIAGSQLREEELTSLSNATVHLSVTSSSQPEAMPVGCRFGRTSNGGRPKLLVES